MGEPGRDRQTGRVTSIDDLVVGVRQSLGAAIFERVAGRDGVEVRERLRDPDADRWFESGSPITHVHGDASMFVGGLGALLLQSLHPLAMAGVDQHSDYRVDPWGRLANESLPGRHDVRIRRGRGTRDRRRQGGPRTGQRRCQRRPAVLGARSASVVVGPPRRGGLVPPCPQPVRGVPLTAAERDEYVAQAGQVARALGADKVPETVSEARRLLEAYRPSWPAPRRPGPPRATWLSTHPCHCTCAVPTC